MSFQNAPSSQNAPSHHNPQPFPHAVAGPKVTQGHAFGPSQQVRSIDSASSRIDHVGFGPRSSLRAIRHTAPCAESHEVTAEGRQAASDGAAAMARSGHTGRRAEWGQATAEYALVILAAAAVAGLALAWAASTGRIGRLLDAVINSVMGNVG